MYQVDSPSLSVRDTLRGRHLMLTGVTGFLGRVWLAMVLDRVPDVRFTVLVRRGSFDSATDRFAHEVDTSPAFRPLKAKYGADLGAWLAERVQVLEGDVAEPACGTDDAELKQVLPTIDAVVHFAGITDFMPDPEKAIATNIRGGENVAELAARTPSRRLVHISTTYTCGNGSRRVAESVPDTAPGGAPFDAAQELAELEAALADVRAVKRVALAKKRAHDHGWPNIYTYTKAIAERLLTARDDIQLTIVRPSVVECALTYPLTGWNEGLNTAAPLAWLITSLFREMPSHGHHHFDYVPVDEVAKGTALIVAAALRDEAEPVYQLAGSDSNPVSFGRTVELTGLALRRYLRKNGGTPLQTMLLKHLDPVPVPLDRQPPWRVENLVGMLEWGKNALRETPATGTAFEPVVERARTATAEAWRQVRRVDQMLELFLPFIHDNDWVFVTDNVRRLDAALVEDERADFGWGVPDIDWCHYWVDVEYPGLRKWSIPILYGEDPPRDAATGLTLEVRTADKLSAK